MIRLDTVRIVKALYNVSNSPRYRNQFQNKVYVADGYAYAANQIACVKIRFPFVCERGLSHWERITYDEDTRRYGFAELEEYPCDFERVLGVNDVQLGFCKFDATELARVLRLFSACGEEPTITVHQDHTMYLEASNGRKDIYMLAKLMGMR